MTLGEKRELHLQVGTSSVKSQDSIKALGVNIDNRLECTNHIGLLSKRVNKIKNGLRIII